MSRLTDWVRGGLGAAERHPLGVTVAESTPPTAAAAAARRGFEVGIPAQGLTEANAQADSLGGVDRKSLLTDLYDAFLACPWSWAAVNAVSKTITGGGISFEWVSDQEGVAGEAVIPEKPRQVREAERLLAWVNAREDMIQLLRSVIADLLVFGDAFIELVWAAGIPVAMYSLDCPSTTPLADTHGNITGYVQQTEQGQKARFEPHEVIHISLDAPRSGVFGVSPTFAAQLPIKVWLFATATLQELFRKGLPANLWVDHPSIMQAGDQKAWQDQHMARNVGVRNIGRPVMTKGGATVKELQASKITEILASRSAARDEIVSAYGVPPAEVGIIEAGNLGGGTGESQRKSFLVNTCQPIAALVLEKLNHVLMQAFGITDWCLRFDDVDMRDSKIIEEIRERRVRTGIWTLNKARTDVGEAPVEGGDLPIFDLGGTAGAITWRDLDAYAKASVAAVANGTVLEPDEPGAATDPMTLSKIEPKPTPPALDALRHQLTETLGLDEDDDEPPREHRVPARSIREADYRARIRRAMHELPAGAGQKEVRDVAA